MQTLCKADKDHQISKLNSSVISTTFGISLPGWRVSTSTFSLISVFFITFVNLLHSFGYLATSDTFLTSFATYEKMWQLSFTCYLKVLETPCKSLFFANLQESYDT